MERNFFRLISLLTDIAPRVLRKFLEDQWQRAGYSSFVDLLNQNKHTFYHCLQPGRHHQRDLCCCGYNKESYKSMTAAQWELMFQDTGSSAACSYIGKHPCQYHAKVGVKLEDLDITLLRLITDKLFPGNTTLDNIRKLRNELIHSGTVIISDIEFWRLWFSARSSILQIANTSVAPFPAEIQQEIDELEKRCFDPNECQRLREIVKHLTHTENLLEGISSEVTVVKHKVESTETKVEAMTSKLKSTEINVEAMNTEVRSMKTKIESTDTNVEAMSTEVRYIRTKAESAETEIEAMKTKVETTETNVKSIKADVESLKANAESIGHKTDEKTKTGRHPDIERRIEITEDKLTSHRKSFYASLGAAEKEAYSRLQTKHLVTISGRAGSGKTSLGKQLMIRYCDQHRAADGTTTYTPVIISKPEDFDKIGSKDCLLVFIDDPLGASNIDDKLLKEWGKHFDNLSPYCTEGNIRIIIGVRSNLISEPEETFRRSDLFSKENIIDLSSTHKLTSPERLQLLKAFCKEYKVQITSERNETGRVSKDTSHGLDQMTNKDISFLNDIKMHVLNEISKLDTFEGFPLACSRFFAIQSLFDQGAYFFKHAAKSLKSEISQFEKKEPLLYFTLSFMLLEGGIIDLDNINEDKLSKMNECLGQTYRTVDIVDCCKCETSKVYIEREQMIFYKNRKIEYSFTHKTVMEAVLLSLRDRYPELVLKLSHYKIIAEFVRPSRYIPRKGELCVKLPSRYHRLLADTVINNGCRSISFYRGIYDAAFVEELLDVMETTETLCVYRGRQASLKQAITELLTDISISQSPLQTAVFTRYTHNGRSLFTPGNKIKSAIKSLFSSKVKSKRPLIDLGEFIFALNYLLEKGFYFKELVMSCELDPLSAYNYRDGDGRDRTIVPIIYATEEKMKHLVFFWVTDTVKGDYLLKEELVYPMLDMCCKWDWADIFEILVQKNKHGQFEKVPSPSSFYINTTSFGRQMVSYFLQSNIDITLTDTSGNTLLHYCSRYGLNTEVLRILKTHQEIVNVRNNDNETAIIMAAKHGENDTVNKMLRHRESNIDVSLPDNHGNTVLHYCCRFGSKTEVLKILEKHPEIVNIRNKYGRTAMTVAAEHRKADIVKEMLQHRARNIDITLTDNNGNSVLHICSIYGLKTEVLRILKTHPEIINIQNHKGETAIITAAIYGYEIIVNEMLRHWDSIIDITVTDTDGNTLLHHCFKNGFITEVLMILKTHPEIVNVQNKDGCTAMMMATIYRKEKTVNELLRHRESNNDITLTDKDGNTLFHYCCKFGLNTELLMILKTHPEIVNVQNKDGETPLCLAAMSGKTDFVKELLQHRESNIDITLPDNNGNTVLHHCSRNLLKNEVLKILETHPELVNVQNKHGQTVIMMAAMSRKNDIVKELLQHQKCNIDITLPDNDGNTLLHFCSRSGLKTEVLMILETHPEMINYQNKDGMTAIIMAAKQKETDTVIEMLRHMEGYIDITLPDNYGNTLIHYCCRIGLKTVVLRILEKHPEILHAQNKHGQTAICLAAMSRKTDIVQEMLQDRESNNDVTLPDNYGNTLLHYCCSFGLKTEVLWILGKHPELVNVQNEDGKTAIMVAVLQKEEGTVNEMLRHKDGINEITLTDKEGNTLFHYCCMFGLKTEVLMILETYPEIVNVQNKNGETAIMIAIIAWNTDIIHELLQHSQNNIDFNLTDNDGNTVLHYCSRIGLKTEVLILLNTHPEIVNIQNKDGETAIIMAAKHMEEKIVNEMLLHRGSNIDLTLPDNEGNTVLLYCSRNCLMTGVLTILKTHSEKVNIQNKDGETAIITAAKYGGKDYVNEMLRCRERKIDISLPDNDGNTLFHYCCIFGLKTEVLMILKAHPEIVNVQNKDGRTAIMMATIYREDKTVNELLRHKDSINDITLTDKEGNTLFHYCCMFGLKTEVLMILETHPEIVNVQNQHGQTAICLTAMSRKTCIVKELLQHKERNIDVTICDIYCNTLLHYCCSFGVRKKVLWILKTHPEIINVQNKNGKTAIIMAAIYGRKKTVHEMLVHGERNIDVALTDKDGNTVLHYCSRRGLRTEVLMILGIHPDIVNVQNKDGETAIIMAAKQREEQTVNEMLLHRESNIDVTLPDNDGNTLLHYCSKYGWKTEVLLIEKRSEMSTKKTSRRKAMSGSNVREY